MLLNEFLEVVQDLSLTFRKWLHAQTPGDGFTEPGLYTKKRRKSIRRSEGGASAVAGPDRDETQSDLPRDIPRGLPEVSIPDECERVETEG